MKFLLSLLSTLCFVLFTSIQIAYSQSIDLDEGEKVFSENCTACHAGGNNVIAAEKTLKLDALEKYEKASVDAIVYQVTNGNAGGMPAFGDRLSDDQIQNVANYVLNQAKTDSW
uniref:Cytochrome c-553 n=1 Tax=Digenea simplex TaxID=945030 RepID=A0A1Z1MUU0_DIGSM|nr:cytochrome c553 [Digenea simplex]ARW69444.1 cytochrome c553 [Digenea simplex]